MLPDPLPSGFKARFELLDQFIGAWFPRVTRPSGVSAAELDAAEDHIGLRLPLGLRRWYERFGARDDVWSVQDRLLSPATLQRVDEVLVFCVENQGVVRWGIRLDSISHEDPPVVVSDLDHADRKWLVEAETTSAFALQFAAVNAKFSGAVKHHANGQITDEAIELVERAYARLPFDDIHWPSYPTRLYAGPDVLVEINALTWVWISARTRLALERAATAVRACGVVFEVCTLDEPSPV